MDNKLLKRASKLLKGKIVKEIKQPRPTEVLIVFEDETRLFIDQNKNGLELSIT